MDRSENQRNVNRGKLPNAFNELVENLDLIDIWRHRNPTTKQFTHYSEPHKSWGRIDQIWVTRAMVWRVKRCEILPRTLSDHCPLVLEIKNELKGQPRWRMNEYLFENEEVLDTAKKTLREYLAINRSRDTPIELVWDAGKAVLRGFLIQQNSYRKKLREKKKDNILAQLKDCERKLALNPTDETISQAVKVLQSQYSVILNQEIEQKIKFTRQKYFESANKMGKLLAWQLRKRKKQNTINKLIVDERVIEEPSEIERRFVAFFEKLYEKGEESSVEIRNYLDQEERKFFTEEDCIQLNKVVSVKEVRDAINKMKNGKSPGPDGLPAKYYKKLVDLLAPVLTEVINNTLQEGRIPSSWKEAYITLIPKTENEKTDLKNYRPISLLNCDYKVFADIMASRLKNLLNRYIHRDQVGFLPGRQMRDNVRHVLDIMEFLEARSDVPAALIFIDAEKAFDRVSWEFLLQNMDKVGIGGPYLKAIRAIYTEQQARLIINNNLTKYFPIMKGTRQGCPLSPLLFILVLETAANKIRATSSIRGLKIGEKEYKLKAYADDLVLFLENPIESISRAVELLEEFGKLSGFKLNRGKTKILIKNLTAQERSQLEQQVDIKVVNKVKYLGIWLSPKNINLVEDNYNKLWKEMKKDMDTWRRLNLSWTGRMASIKMCILPRLLFLFQNLPVIKGTACFKNWQRTLTKYIWQEKKPRVKLKYLTDSRERGGFGVPNLRLYYEAACLLWIKEWVTLKDTDLLDLEGFDLRFGWHAYLWQEKDKIHRGFYNHSVRGPLLEVWNRKKSVIEQSIPWWLSPVDIIKIKKVNMTGRRWTYEDLLIKSEEGWKLRQQDELKEKIKDWFHLHQINALWREHKRIDMGENKSRFQVEIIESNNKLLSKMYRQLLENENKEVLIKEVMIKWNKDLGYELGYDKWQTLWKNGMRFTACADLRENLYKMMYRWYLTPARLGRMYRTADNTCWRCKDKVGTFIHIWWTCGEVKGFWGQIYEELKKILKYNFPKNPEALLLGMIGEEIKKSDQTFFQYATTAARILIAKKWKSPEIPTMREWRVKLYQYVELARLTQYIRRDNLKKTEDWSKFLSYLEINLGINNLTVDDV
uniref:Reverse transcriptase domain-containing protein n=1 Tax=Podarcis muralis TaxID=64176 RepID=A0A670HTD8_PODMU